MNILIIICIVSIIYMFSRMFIAINSSSWNSTVGTILSIKIDKIVKHAKFESLIDNEVIKLVHIKYEYYVGDKKYISSRIRYGFELNYSNNKKYINDYHTNSNVTVFYNKCFTWMSVLEPGLNNAGVKLFTVSLISLLLIGICLAVNLIIKMA